MTDAERHDEGVCAGPDAPDPKRVPWEQPGLGWADRWVDTWGAMVRWPLTTFRQCAPGSLPAALGFLGLSSLAPGLLLMLQLYLTEDLAVFYGLPDQPALVAVSAVASVLILASLMMLSALWVGATYWVGVSFAGGRVSLPDSLWTAAYLSLLPTLGCAFGAFFESMVAGSNASDETLAVVTKVFFALWLAGHLWTFVVLSRLAPERDAVPAGRGWQAGFAPVVPPTMLVALLFALYGLWLIAPSP